MLPDNISFVDIETTGTSVRNNRIIEIGILRIEKNKLVKTLSTVINPESRIDPFIFNLTGISEAEIDSAPTFNSVKDEVLELLKDSVFVAHNVRFDYGFLRNEFKRHEISFTSKHFCTVKLARHLFPGFKNYNLDSIIERHNISCKRRHRAFDDAKVLFEFYKKAKRKFGPEELSKAIDLSMKRPTVPLNISHAILDDLPETPGVYIFYGKSGAPLYIGKSVNIRDRVLSHFSNDHLSSSDMAISQQIESIETFPTAGELGALLLESTLIKKHQPLYNRQLRHARRVVVVEKNIVKDYASAKITEKEDIAITDLGNVIGVFRSIQQAKEYLYSLCKENALCPKMLGLEKTNRHCFYYSLGTCNGACIGKEKALKYNMRFIQATSSKKIKQWPFKGPIIINENGDSQDNFLVDKWCFLGKVNEENYNYITENEYRFDNDTYKILFRFLSDNRNLHKIKEIKL